MFLYGEEGSWEWGRRREGIMKSWKDSEKRGIEGGWFCKFCFTLALNVRDILCSLVWFAGLAGTCRLFLEILLSDSLFFMTVAIFCLGNIFNCSKENENAKQSPNCVTITVGNQGVNITLYQTHQYFCYWSVQVMCCSDSLRKRGKSSVWCP